MIRGEGMSAFEQVLETNYLVARGLFEELDLDDIRNLKNTSKKLHQLLDPGDGACYYAWANMSLVRRVDDVARSRLFTFGLPSLALFPALPLSFDNGKMMRYLGSEGLN